MKLVLFLLDYNFWEWQPCHSYEEGYGFHQNYNTFISDGIKAWNDNPWNLAPTEIKNAQTYVRAQTSIAIAIALIRYVHVPNRPLNMVIYIYERSACMVR